VSTRFRLLIAAEAAYRIATSSHHVVMHDPETYEAVRISLASLKDDVRRLIGQFALESVDGKKP
jgi:hypothetical protein